MQELNLAIQPGYVSGTLCTATQTTASTFHCQAGNVSRPAAST